MKISLFKNTRYYHISFFQNLFGEFEVECVYGNINFKTPTGVIRRFFQNQQDGMIFLEEKLKIRQKHGYDILKKCKKCISSNVFGIL